MCHKFISIDKKPFRTFACCKQRLRREPPRNEDMSGIYQTPERKCVTVISEYRMPQSSALSRNWRANKCTQKSAQNNPWGNLTQSPHARDHVYVYAGICASLTSLGMYL